MHKFFKPDKEYFKSKRFIIHLIIIIVFAFLINIGINLSLTNYTNESNKLIDENKKETEKEKETIKNKVDEIKEQQRIAEEKKKKEEEEAKIKKQKEEEEKKKKAEEERKKKEEEERIKAEEEKKKKDEEEYAKWMAKEYEKYHYNKDGLKIDIEPVILADPNNVYYWVCDIEVSSSDRLKYALSNDTYGGLREQTSITTAQKGGILGINSSGFSFQTGKPTGIIIQEGKIINGGTTNQDTMAFNKAGIMYTPEVGTTAEQLVADGVRFTTQFGPVLINNGERLSIADGRPSGYYPRTAIGQISPTKYVVIVADGKRSNYSVGLSPSQLQDIFEKKGCKYAYNLDGGGSTSLYFKGRLINDPSDGVERTVADILYFK